MDACQLKSGNRFPPTPRSRCNVPPPSPSPLSNEDLLVWSQPWDNGESAPVEFVRAMAAELLEARKILATLPKTVDGAAIYLGRSSFIIVKDTMELPIRVREFPINKMCPHSVVVGGYRRLFRELFSSQSAALAELARRKSQGGQP